MDDLMAARSQMAMSLGFHIIFAVAGMALPWLMIIAEGLWLRTRQEVYLTLARRWAHATAILFAIGAVSGTVLSFELGLLWPNFMAFAGPIIGMPFSLEGFAFFLEAIFLGIYLYGWQRVPPLAHWLAGVIVGLSGILAAAFVVTANAWMNTPTGFDIVNGEVTNIRPFEAMFNPGAFGQVLHMTIAAFQALGFGLAGIYALLLLFRPQAHLRYRRYGLAIALAVGTLAAMVQPLSGDLLAKHVAKYQPIKLAAMEAQWETQRGAPMRIGGWPDEQAEETRYAIEIPYALSFMAHMDPQAEIMGLKDVPPENRPPVAVVHIAFQIMVASGMTMLAVGLLGVGLAWKDKRIPDHRRWYLWLVMFCGPLGFIAIEAGWVVTEVGRQPWVVYNLIRTADAVTPMPGLVVPFATFTVLYLVLTVVMIILLARYVFAGHPKLPTAPTTGPLGEVEHGTV